MKKESHYKNVGVVLMVLFIIAFLYKISSLFWGVVICGAVLYTFEGLAILFSRYWMHLGKLLGEINSRIILSIFFILILAPTALLKKLLSSSKNEGGSTWVEENSSVDFTKPW